jgi:hypothetical protein
VNDVPVVANGCVVTDVPEFRYQSGEEIRDGDRILYHGESGYVEFVVSRRTDNPERDWFLDEFGGGVMVNAETFGSVFIHEPHDDEDLELVARAR